MKHIVLTAVFAILFGFSAFAQSSDPQPPAQGTNPSAEPGTASQNAPAQAPDMGNPGQSSQHQAKNEKSEKGEKKLKGCLRSEGGKFVLEEKHGKRVNLNSSEDLSSHVNQTVAVHGSFENGSGAMSESTSATGTSSTDAAGASSSGEQFTVSKIDKVSDTCKGEATKGEATSPEPSKPSPYRH